MAGDDWTDWADGSDLAGLSRSTAPLSAMGYDPDELRANPASRAEAVGKLAGPYAAPQAPETKGAQDQAQAAQQSAQIAQGGPAPAIAPRGPVPAAPAPTAPTPRLMSRVIDKGPAAPAATGAGRSVPETLGPAADAVTAPAASNPAAPSPTPTAAPWQADAAEAARGELDLAKQAQGAFTALPSAPDTAGIDTRIETESLPTNRAATDPATGKPLYKPTVGQRIVRGLEGFAAGGIPGVLDPKRYGATAYGAPNAAYQTAEAGRTQALQSDEQKKADLLARFNLASKTALDRAKGIETVAPDYKDAGTVATDAQNAQTNQQKADTAAAAEQNRATEASPAGKAAVTQAEFDQYGKEADNLHLTGYMRSLFIGNKGKLPDPKQATAEETARATAMRTFRQQYGRDPQTLDEINQVNASAGGRLKDESLSDTPPDPVRAAAQSGLANVTAYTTQWRRNADGSYQSATPDTFKRISGAEYEATVGKLRDQANKGIAKQGWMIDGQGQLVKTPEAAAKAAAPAAGKPQPAPDGTRRQGPKGEIEVKRAGRWVPE